MKGWLNGDWGAVWWAVAWLPWVRETGWGEALTEGEFAGIRVLDGGMATELERRGFDLRGPLWSAHVLDEAPEAIAAVHLDYLRAGADCIETASYQISALGYRELGRGDWARALGRSVELAEAARRARDRPVVVLAHPSQAVVEVLKDGLPKLYDEGIGVYPVREILARAPHKTDVSAQ